MGWVGAFPYQKQRYTNLSWVRLRLGWAVTKTKVTIVKSSSAPIQSYKILCLILWFDLFNITEFVTEVQCHKF